jgi:glucosamine-6-phosphate deaminase
LEDIKNGSCLKDTAMEVIIKQNYAEVCAEAAATVQETWTGKTDLVMGFATGKTPLGLYEKLIELYHQGGIDFASVKAFNLDEYVGLEESHPQSFAWPWTITCSARSA